MIISRNLLTYLLPSLSELSNEQISNGLLQAGIEVEGVYHHYQPKNLSFGYIHEVINHPKSNKLKICKVELADHSIHSIVCGGQNAKAKLKVIVATKGCKLFNGLIIENREILGVQSSGMICSYKELQGLNIKNEQAEDNIEHQIIELDNDFDVFQTFDPKVIGLDDVIFDLSIPSNRTDLACAFGIVLELAARYQIKYDYLSYESLLIFFNKNLVKKNDFNFIFEENTIDAAIFLDLNHCKINFSSWKIKSLLLNNNQKCLNNFLDYSSLLTLLFHQPTHSNDATFLETPQIEIKQNLKKKFFALNNKEYLLTNDDIVVTDQSNNILALGGIIGGNKTAINLKTEHIYFELINFNWLKIQKSNQHHQVNTISAITNSKAKSNYLTLLAAYHAFNWFNKIAKIEVITLINNPPDFKKIKINYNKLELTLGKHIDWIKVNQYLKYLGFENQEAQILVPPWRLDIENENDILEEIIKFYGIETIESNPPITFATVNKQKSKIFYQRKIAQLWSNFHFQEAKTYNLQLQEQILENNFMGWDNALVLSNSLNSNISTMRMHALNQLLDVYKQNLDNQNWKSSWFELAQIHLKNVNYQTLNILSTLNNYQSNINKSKIVGDLYDLKALLLKTAQICHMKIYFSELKKVNLAPKFENVFLKQNTLAIYDDQDNLIGYVGQLALNFVKKYKLNLEQPLFAAFLILVYENKPIIIEVPKYSIFPSSFKDFSISYKKGLKLNYVIDEIKKITFVQNVTIKELWNKNNEQINCLLQLRLGSLTSTLKQKEIQDLLQNINHLFVKFNITIR